jgi:hypothetical protein
MRQRMVYKDIGNTHRYEKLAMVRLHHPTAEWGPYSSFYVDGIMVATMAKDQQTTPPYSTRYDIYIFPMATIKPLTINLTTVRS